MLKDLFSNKLKDTFLQKKTIASNALKRLEEHGDRDRKIGSLEDLLNEKPSEAASPTDRVDAEHSSQSEDTPQTTASDADGSADSSAQNFVMFDETGQPMEEKPAVSVDKAGDQPPSEQPFEHTEAVTLKSLRAVAQRIVGAAQQKKGITVLVSSEPPEYDITAEVIDMAREIADGKVKILLLDRSESLHVLSSTLGLPRTPGIRELLSGDALVEDVIKRDPESNMQFISAGNPRLRVANAAQGINFDVMVDALQEVYDCVIIHADCNTARSLFSESKDQLAAAVVVGGPKAPKRGKAAAMPHDFLGVDANGKTVIRYEQPVNQRASLFGIKLPG